MECVCLGMSPAKIGLQHDLPRVHNTVAVPVKQVANMSRFPAGPGMTQAELQMSGEWAAVTLEATQYVAGPDLSHAASCAAIAQVMRELAGASAQEGEAVVEAERTRPAVQSIPRCGQGCVHGQPFDRAQTASSKAFDWEEGALSL